MGRSPATKYWGKLLQRLRPTRHPIIGVAPPYLEIEWWDSASEGGWIAHHFVRDVNVSNLTRCVTRGWMAKLTPSEVLLVSSWADTQHWGGFWSIPLQCIRNVRRV